jgi:hypothetical protein
VQITAQKSLIVFAPISEKVSSEKDQLIQKKTIFIFTSWNWLLPTKPKKPTIITSFL